MEECLVNATLEDGIAYGVSDEVFWRKDGTSFPVEYTSTPIREQDEVTGAVLVFRDITERVRAEAEIERLARFPSENPSPVLRVLNDGTVLYGNQASAVLLSAWGRRVGERLPDVWQKVVSSALDSASPRTAEMGTRDHVFALTFAPVPEQGYANVYGLDVTARRQAEDALRKRTHDLGERVKELNCLFGISNLVQEPGTSLEEVLQGIADLIPPAWQYPDVTCARIVFGDREFRAGDPDECAWRQSAEITVQGEHVGLVEVGYLKERPAGDEGPFSKEERSLLDAIVERLGRIVERRRAEHALRRYADRLQVLREMDQAILAARSVEEIAESALRYMPKLVSCLRASVAVFDLEANEVSLLAVHTDGQTQVGRGWHGSLERGWTAKDPSQNQIHAVEDVQVLSPASQWIRALQSEGIRAFVNVPLVISGELIGSLNLGMDEPGHLTPEQTDIAWEMADQLAIAIQQARLHAQVQSHADELEREVARRTAALRVSQARFRAIFEQAAVGIVLVSRDGRIVEANPALQRTLGYSAKGLKDMTFAELGYPDDVAVDVHLFEELIAGQRNDYRVDKRFIQKDGALIDAHLTVSLVQPARDRARFAIAMVQDITEQTQAQAALVRSEKLALTGRLAASLAHEISNPLQSVIGCLSLAEEILRDGGDVSEHLQIALNELQRTARIVGRLRDLSRSAKPEERELVDVNALVSKVLVLTRKRCQNQRIEVVWNGMDRLPSVPLMPDRMHQVFLNIALNAMDAMPHGGRLQVCTARTSAPDGVRIAFADDGVGMDTDTLSLLFEPFHSTRLDGLGLGLYVSHTIVEDHAGYIEAESEPEKGTTLTVWLPARKRGIDV